MSAGRRKNIEQSKLADSAVFGIATAGQLQQFIEMQSQTEVLRKQFIADGQAKELVESVRGTADAELLDWGWHYEMPLAKHAAMLLACFVDSEEISKIAQSGSQVADLLHVASDENAPRVEQKIESLTRQQAILAIALAQSALMSFRAIANYSASINQLVERVRNKQSDKALFQAVSIDRCVLSAPTISARICQAQVMDDEPFLAALSKAMNRPHEKRRLHSRLRIAELMLHECNARSTANTGELNRLLSEKLKVFDSRNGPKALLALLQQFRQEATD